MSFLFFNPVVIIKYQMSRLSKILLLVNDNDINKGIHILNFTLAFI